MRTIRASELASFVYCRRAWGYWRDGLETANQAELAEGVQSHARHGRGLRLALWQRRLAYACLLAALFLVIYALIGASF